MHATHARRARARRNIAPRLIATGYRVHSELSPVFCLITGHQCSFLSSLEQRTELVRAWLRRCTARAGIERGLISVLDQLCTLRRRREGTVRGGELDVVFFCARAHVRGDKVKMVILTRHLGARFLLASLAKESSIERADRFIIVTAVTRERESEKRINVENKR